MDKAILNLSTIKDAVSFLHTKEWNDFEKKQDAVIKKQHDALTSQSHLLLDTDKIFKAGFDSIQKRNEAKEKHDMQSAESWIRQNNYDSQPSGSEIVASYT